MIETWGKNESFISIFSSITKYNLVLGWDEFGDFGTNIGS
jgi:hypothetical protein